MDRENKERSLTQLPVESSVGVLQKGVDDPDVLAQDDAFKENQTGEPIDCMDSAGDYNLESVEGGSWESAAVGSRESANDDSRESANDDSRESANDDSRESANDYNQESANDYNQESANDYNQESANDYNQESANDASQESANDYGQESANDYGQESANDYGQESANDYGQESANDDCQESANDDCQESANNSQDSTDDDSQDSTDDDSQDSTDDDSQDSTDDESQDSTDDDSQDSTDDDSQESTDDDSQESTDDDSQESTDDDSQESTDDDSQESTDDYSLEFTDDRRSRDNLETSFDRESEFDQYLAILDLKLEESFCNYAYIAGWVVESTRESNSMYNLELVEPDTPVNRSNASNGSDSSGNMTSDTYRGVPYHGRWTPEGGRISHTGVKIFGTGIAYDRGYPLQYNYENTSPYPVQLNGTTYYNTALQARYRNQYFGPYQMINPSNYYGFQQPFGQFQANILNYKSCFCPFNCTCASIPMPPPNFVGFGVYPRPPLPPIGFYQQPRNVPVVTLYDPRFNYSDRQNGLFLSSNFVNRVPLPHFRPAPGNGWYGNR